MHDTLTRSVMSVNTKVTLELAINAANKRYLATYTVIVRKPEKPPSSNHPALRSERMRSSLDGLPCDLSGGGVDIDKAIRKVLTRGESDGSHHYLASGFADAT